MKAVILAAGLGSRLEPLTNNIPKCMVPVAGVSLIERLIGRIAEAGVSELIVVSGYLDEVLREHLAASAHDLARRAQVIFNARYADWGNCYSLLVAREAVGDSSFLKLDGDVLLDSTILPKLMRAPGPAVLGIDCRDDLSAEDMKVRVDDSGRLVELNKRVDPAMALGEFIGAERIDAELVPALFDELDEMIRSGETGEYYERAYERLMQRGIRFSYADVHGSLWCEIDDAADLERARDLIARQDRAAASM